MDLEQKDKNDNLISSYVEAFNLTPELKNLFSENDKLFAESLKHYTFLNLRTSKNGQLYPQQVGIKIETILMSKLFFRVNILNDILAFLTNRDKRNKINNQITEIDFSQQIAERALVQDDYELFELFLNYIEYKHIKQETKSQIKSILSLGQDSMVNQEHQKKLQQKFKELKTDEDFKFMSIFSIINLQRLKTKPTIKVEQIEQILQIFKVERTNKSQRILQTLLRLDTTAISQFVQTAIYTKLTIDTVVKYQQNESIHSSFFTQQNILMFCSYLNNHRKISSLYLFASKQSIIQNQKGVYLLLPIETYPKTMDQEILNLTNQLPDLLHFTRTILTAIKQNKPIYSPFEELTFSKKITLLTFCCNIFRYVPEYDDQDGADINLITQSNLIPDMLIFITEILDKKESQNINELVLLFSTLAKGFIIYPLDPTNLNRLSNSGIIESIYKILTSYPNSIYFFNDLLFLYEHQFRNILRACNKIDLFETSLLIDKIIQSVLSFSQINTSQMGNLVSLLIESKPAFEEQVKSKITTITNEYLQKPKQFFKDLKHSIELKIISTKVNLLLKMKTIKTSSEMKLMNIKLRKLNYESSNYNRHNSIDFDILDYKDIDMNQSEMVVSLDQTIVTLKSQEFKNSFTFGQLKEQVSLPIHKKFFDDMYNILAFMNYHSKDVHKAFSTLYEKIVEVYVLYIAINFNNNKVVQKGISELKQEQVIILRKNIEGFSYVETQSLFDYFTGVGQIYAENLDFLLRVNTKSIVPYAAKVPLTGFMKSLGKLIEVIKKSQDKQQIIFYINSFEKIWQFSQGGFMSVQSYYYLYTIYRTEIYQIVNKIFDQIKGQISHWKPLSHKSKTFKDFIIQDANKQNNLEKRLFESAHSFLRIFILRKLTVLSWVAENQPNEHVYGNTKNLALGIYLDQFTLLVANLNENNILFYKDLLKKFFNRNIQKTRLFQQQNVSHRRGNNLRARRQVVEVLNTMGYGAQVVDMVLNQLQDMSIDGAIDWINNHHQQIQTFQQTNLIRQTLLNSMQKQKSSNQKTIAPSGIKQITVDQYNSEFKQPLKILFKKHFISAIYGKNKDKLPQLIILLIQRYDKQQTRNSNYVQFINYLIKQLNNELKNKQHLNIERIVVQFSHLTLILQKCSSKKEIRENILKSSLITDLVVIIHVIGHKQKVKEEQQKVLQTALKIIKVLVPKKSNADISNELDSILDELIIVKQRQNFNIDEHFWTLTTQRLNYPISEVKLYKILNVLFEDFEKGKTDCNYGEVIEIILQSDTKFLQANIEAEIKTYFFNEGQNKIVSKLKRQFVIHFDRYNNNPVFYKTIGQILKKKNEKLYNNRKATYLIYQKDKQSYTQSIVLQKPFIQYSPTQIQVNILERFFSIFSKQSEPTKIKFNLLHRILERFPLLRHYCLFQSQNNTTFIDQLLNNIPHYKSKIDNVFTFFGSAFGIIFKQKEKQYYYSTYLQYYIVTKLREIFENEKDGNQSRYVSLCYLLQFKLFNDISNQSVSQTVCSLRRLLEKQFTAQNQFISEPLTLLYKQMTIKAISSLYVVADQDSLSQFQSQLILLPLMCVSEEENNRSPLDRLEQLQLGLDALTDPNAFLARLQGGSSRFAQILRRQLVNDIPFEFLPIQPKGQRKQSKVSNQGQIQKVIQKQQQLIEKPQAKFIVNTFDSIPVSKSQNHSTTDLKEQEQSIILNYSLFNQQLPYISPREYKIAYVTKMNEPLYKRINLLWKQLCPEEQVIQKKQNQKQMKKIPSLLQRHSIEQNLQDEQEEDIEIQYTRRIGDGLNPFVDNGVPAERFSRNMRIVRNVGDGRGIAFEVDFGGRRRDIQNQHQLQQQRQQQQQQQQQLNEAEIQKVLQQYVQQKKPEQPKIVQKVEEKVEEKKQQQQEVKQKVQEKQEKIESNQAEIQVVKQKIQQKIEQKQQQKVEEKVEQTAENKIQQKVEEKQQQKVQENKQQTNVVPPSSPPAPPAQINTNPPVFRQILQTVGVPQNFLRMHGVIQQQFDSMPQQVKVDLLFQLISSQEQPEEAKHDDPIPIDILQNIPAQMRQQLGVGNFGQAMTQTQILLASIDDQQMRQQIFLQASPEIISALPVVLQQQAQGIRQRRIRQIAAQQQQQYMIGNHQRRRIRRNKQNLIYPQVSKELFQKLDNKTLFQIVRTLFFKASNNNLHLLQSVIQNKQNQQQIINTLIYILRSPLNVSEFPSQIKQKVNNEWKIVADGSQLLTNLILTTLQRIVKSSPYKDIKFLKQKISYNGLNQIKLQPKQELFIENYVNQQFHYPFIQILTYSLKSNLNLSAYLLEGFDIVNIPKIILELIVETFKLNSLPEDYINSLKGLSDNAILKELFIATFTIKNHPKISILAQILKYPFSRVDYLKTLHLKILNAYKPEYNNFLNEIYRIYTIQELKNMKNLENYKSIHKQVIKEVLKSSNIFTEPISIILKLPFLIDFETKREIFYQKVQDWNEEGGHVGRLELRIDRNNLFSGSFSQIAPRTKQQMRGRINVTFEDEGAYDAGGPTKQWFLVVSRQMFNQNYALFQNSSSGNTYHPSSKSYINPDHLRYFKFIGRIVGKALMQKCYIDAYFTRSFYKMILGQDLTLQDMQSSDFNFYKSMLWVKDNKIEDDFYRFAYDIQNFGKIETIELVPNGKNIEVTQANKHEFVQKICLVKMKTQTHQQIKAFLQGFHQLIPIESIQYFTAEELELLISGLPTVDIEDLRRHTEYVGYTENSKQILWFWQILQTLDQEYLTKMIQFITGTSKIPPQGFKGLRGMHGNQKISIHKDFAVDQLPKSHTCFNQLDLPQYPTKEIMEIKLKIALNWGSESFGFM